LYGELVEWGKLIMYTTLPLYEDSSYSYTTTLGGVAYLFEFFWSNRQGCYHFDVYSEGRSPFSLGNLLAVQAYPIIWDDNGSTLMCLPRIPATSPSPTREETPTTLSLVFFER